MTSTDALTADVARWLVSTDGLASIDQAATDLRARMTTLDVLTRLRGSGLDQVRASGVLSCAEARTRGDRSTQDLVFTKEALEQASPSLCATWRARRFEAATDVVDLCSGAGADAVALGRTARIAAVDIDEGRAILARHNMVTRAIQGSVTVADALDLPFGSIDVVHADPGRRRSGKRSRTTAEYSPPLDRLLSSIRSAHGACVLLSPGVDLDDPAIPEDAELEFIQVHNDLVECALWLGSLRGPQSRATATLLPAGESVIRSDEPARLPVGPVGPFLLEPHVAAVRARVHELLGRRCNARRIARSRSLMTTDEADNVSSWWRSWRVEADLAFHVKTLASWLRSAEALPVEIELLGHQTDVDQLWRALGRPVRGPMGRRIFIVRTDAGVRAFVCVRHDRNGA